MLRCICGHIIYDFFREPMVSLPYKAYFLPDEDLNPALNTLMSELAAFIEARERGEQEQYVQEWGLALQHSATLKDILVRMCSYPNPAFELDHGRAMYECEACGRLWMHTSPHRAEWVSYMPESSERGILTHDGTSEDE
jgi:hypothetical protein